MSKAQETYQAALAALQQAEEHLRDLELKVSSQAEVAVADDKLVRDAIRSGRSPGKDVHAKRREHRDLISDLRLEAEAAKTVASERKEEERVAFVAMERERQGLLHERAAALARLMRERLEEIREMAGELTTVSETHRRSRQKALDRSDPGPNSPDPITKNIPSRAWSKLLEALKATA